MKKALKVLIPIVSIIVVLIIILLVNYYYLKKTHNKPFYAIDYASNKIAHGIRYDGLIFSTFECKDGNYEVKTRFTKYTCSNKRIFKNGIYINDLGVEISESDYQKYFQTGNYFKATDVDDLTKDDYEAILYSAQEIEKGNQLEYKIMDEKSSDGYKLMLEITSQKEYCYYGYIKNKNFILGTYENNQCQIPENICEYFTNSQAVLDDKLTDTYLCKCRCDNCKIETEN